MSGRHVTHAIALLALATWAGSRPGAQVSTGRFDLDVQRSSVLKVRKSHVDARNVFAVYRTFLNGRTKGLEIHMYTAPIDASARARLLKDERDDGGLISKGAGYLMFFLDKDNRITQANVTITVPGTTVTRTVAYMPADIAKWFSDYHYADGRLRLNSKGTYSGGSDPKDEKLLLSWDVALDVPVVNRITDR